MKNGPAAGFREEEIFSYVSLVCFARRVRDHVAEHFGHWIPRDEWDMLDDTVKQMAAEKVKEARMLPGVWREHSQTAETPVRWWSKVLPDGRMLGVSEHLSGKRCRACVLPAGFTDENATHIELGYKFLHPETAMRAAEKAARVKCSQVVKRGHRHCRRWSSHFDENVRRWYCHQHRGRSTADAEEVSQAPRVLSS